MTIRNNYERGKYRILNLNTGSTSNAGLSNAITGAENIGTGIGVYSGKTTNTLQFKTLKGGNNISISNSANEITFSLTGETGSVTGATQGLSLLNGGKQIGLGGDVSNGRQINISNNGYVDFTAQANSGMFASLHVEPSTVGIESYNNDNDKFSFLYAGQGQIDLGAGDINEGTDSLLTFNANGEIIVTSAFPNFQGLKYSGNYSSGFGKHSIVDKHYVTGLTSSLNTTATNGLTKTGNNIQLGGALTSSISLNGAYAVRLGNVTPLSNFGVNVAGEAGIVSFSENDDVYEASGIGFGVSQIELYYQYNSNSESIYNGISCASNGITLSGVAQDDSQTKILSLNENDLAVWIDKSSLTSIVSLNRQAVSGYTLQLSDAGKVIETNYASDNTVTIPLNSSVAFPTGTKITIIQYGAGTTTITGAGGVTIRSVNNANKIAGQYGAAEVIKIGIDEWYLIGNLTT